MKTITNQHNLRSNRKGEPVSLLIKPASGNCNMRCRYCFYTDEMDKRQVASYGVMDAGILEGVLQNALSYAKGHCTMAFQGGEPTLAGISYFRQAVRLAEKYNINDCELHYAIQTNGYSMDEEWARFLKENQFLVGISLDGYEEIHDHYRKDALGHGTHQRVMESIALLKSYQVEFNVLTVIHNESVKNAKKIYNFFKRNDLRYQQYIECLDPLGEPCGESEYALTPDAYAQFLMDLFDKWYRDLMRGQYVYIRYFENLMMLLSGRAPESCNMLGRCGKQWVVEADGSVYPCDFYVLDQWKLGNLLTDTMEDIELHREKSGFIDCSLYLPEECRSCRWYALCRNGCRRNCEPVSINSRKKNVFCTAYQQFFEYAYPRLAEVWNRWCQ